MSAVNNYTSLFKRAQIENWTIRCLKCTIAMAKTFDTQVIKPTDVNYLVYVLEDMIKDIKEEQKQRSYIRNLKER